MKSIRLKRSSVANKKPSVTGATPQLDYGDLALNYNATSPTLFSRADDDTLLEWHAGLELPPTTKAGDVLTLEATGTAAPVPSWKTPPAAMRELLAVLTNAAFSVGVPGAVPFGVGPVPPSGTAFAGLGIKDYSPVHLASGSFC